MRIVYLLIGLLSFLPLLVSGQTISLQQTNSGGTFCTGSVMSVSFTTSGTFAADNSFRVQLSDNYGSSYSDLPGMFTSSPASVTLPTISVSGNTYVVRVLATKPLIVSQPSYSFRIAAKPAAQLTGNSSRNVPLNPYSTVNLTMALTGGSPYTITLQDSTRSTKYEDYSLTSDFPVSPARTTTYSLASVQNACGTGPVSGSTTVQINSVGFQLLARANENFCLGAQVPVYFSTTAPLPANTTFEAELISSYDGNRSITLPVSGTASPLLITLPKQHVGSMTFGYQLRIFSRTAGVSAFYRDGNTFSLNTSPRLSLAVSPASIPFGGQTSLILSTTATTAGNVLLSDGRQIIYYGGTGETNSTPVLPTATTSYSIVSYAGVCSEGVSYGNRTVVVQVRPGMRVDSLSASEVCSGQPLQLYYSVTPGHTVPDRIRVRYGNGYVTDGTIVKPGQVSFIPVTSLAFQNQPIQLVNALVDTVLAQTSLPLSIKTKPFLSFARDQQTVSNAGDMSLETAYFGGGTTQLVLNTGARAVLTGGYLQSFSSSTYVPLYVSGTTTFSVVSISNECGVGPISTTRPSTTVTVQNTSVAPTGVVIRPVDSFLYNVCPGSRQGINLFTTGTFNADNQFQLEISGTNGSFSGSPVQSFSKAEAISFTVPTVFGSYRVRVSSTSPVTRSNEQTIFVTGVPTASVSLSERLPDGAVGSLTLAAGQRITASYTFSGGRSPYDYELGNGVKGRSDYGFQTTYQPYTASNFGLVRVTDACGTTATVTSQAPAVVVVPSLIRTEEVYPLQVCVQTPVLVPYTQFGSVPASASFVVQVSEDLLSWQTAPTSGTSSPLSVSVPASLANKQVYYRVAYQLPDGTLVAGSRYASKLQIKSTPNVLLTTPGNATAVQIDRANSMAAEIRLIDLSSDATVVLVGGSTVLRAGASATGNSYYINQPGTYSVVSAVNACGYGQATGLLKITEKPYLTLLKASRTSACVGQTVSFSYAAAGDYNQGNKLSIYLVDNYASSSTKSLLAETTALSGVYTFTLSPSLKPSSYSVQLEASSPATTLNGFIVTVDAPISATLLPGGSGVFYQNDTHYLRVLSTATNSYSLTIASPGGQLSINPGFSIYDFPVQMTQSGSYSISSVTNQCGAGRATGLYSVSVIPASSVTIRPSLFGGPFCTGKEYQLFMNTTGVFSTTNTFTAYLSDSTGATVRTLPTVSSASQLTITIPAGLPDGDRYTIRVGSSSPQHLGASVAQTISIRQAPTGALTGNTSIFKGDSARVSVALTGTPPWRFVLTDFFGPRVFTTSTTPYVLTVKPDTTAGFRLTEVSNSQCGVGTATGTALITVTKLLATEPALPLQVRTWPNPTAGWLQLEGDVPGQVDVLIGVYNVAGTLVQTSVGAVHQGQLRHRIDLSNQPAGMYILTAEQEGRRSQFKVMKE